MLPASVLPVLAEAIDEQLGVAGRASADPDPDAIHDLRVATRRLRAALEMWLAVARGKKLDRSRRTLRRLGKRLGSLRETDVNVSQLSELRARHPADALAFEFILGSEMRRRKKRAKRLQKELRRVDLADLAKEIRSETQDVLDSETPEGAELAVSARKELRERLPRISSLLDRALQRPTSTGLHRLRIELKKFRYSVELCAPAYDKRRVPALIGKLKALQDALGIAHDANALHARIAELRADLRREGLLALERSLLPPLRAVARVSRERTAAAIHELESCRRAAFFSKFEAALKSSG